MVGFISLLLSVCVINVRITTRFFFSSEEIGIVYLYIYIHIRMHVVQHGCTVTTVVYEFVYRIHVQKETLQMQLVLYYFFQFFFVNQTQ